MERSEKFKVGDKVKPKNPKWKHGVGKIIKIDERSNWVWVKYITSSCVVCNDESCGYAMNNKWDRPHNLERMVMKNEQLLFEFMKS